MKIKKAIKGLLVILCFSALIACKESSSNNTSTTTETTSSSNTQNATYTSKMTKSDKKKYYDADGNVVYEVKYKNDGLKLRTASSTLLWKVKFYDNKVKISDNEENENPYEIKMKENQVAKLVKNDETIATTAYNLETQTQWITIYNSPGTEPQIVVTSSYAPGLLLNVISEIPKDQKRILINELKAKGY